MKILINKEWHNKRVDFFVDEVMKKSLHKKEKHF